MIFDLYVDHFVEYQKKFEVCRNESSQSKLYLARVGKIIVSLEILKPERTKTRGQTSKDGSGS